MNVQYVERLILVHSLKLQKTNLELLHSCRKSQQVCLQLKLSIIKDILWKKIGLKKDTITAALSP